MDCWVQFQYDIQVAPQKFTHPSYANIDTRVSGTRSHE